MSVCDSTCRPCIYHATVTGGALVCDYLLVMGRRRGCPAGKGCTERIAGKKAPSLDSRLYRLPPNPERGTPSSGASRHLPRGEATAAAGRGTGVPSSAPSGHLPPGEGRPSSALRAPSPGGRREMEEKIAEQKRRKAEWRKGWYARNKDRLMEYQREYRARKREEAL